MTMLVAGPRQTISRVVHPQRGSGIAVYHHGASFFRPSGATPDKAVAMPVTEGGWSSTGSPSDAAKSWSYVILHDPDHGTVRAEVLAAGERHERRWSPLWGDGWLVWGDRYAMRFEADAGTVYRFEWSVVSVGTPEYVARQARTKKDLPLSDEDKRWTTFNGRDGMVYPFRDSALTQPVATQVAPAQMEMFAR